MAARVIAYTRERGDGIVYLLPELIDMGLTDGEQWKSHAHNLVAMAVCLGNPLVATKDALVQTVSAINAIPDDRIKSVTMADLINEFGVPNISNWRERQAMLEEVNHGDPPPTSPRAISQAVQNSQLRKEIDELRQSLAERDRECERLREENERLCEQSNRGVEACFIADAADMEGLGLWQRTVQGVMFVPHADLPTNIVIGEGQRVYPVRFVYECQKPAAPSGDSE